MAVIIFLIEIFREIQGITLQCQTPKLKAAHIRSLDKEMDGEGDMAKPENSIAMGIQSETSTLLIMDEGTQIRINTTMCQIQLAERPVEEITDLSSKRWEFYG